MAFTDAEMAVLAQLAYYTVKIPEGEKGIYLAEFLNNNRKSLQKDLNGNYNDVIEKLIEKTENSDYRIIKSKNDKSGTGFAAVAIKDPNNEVTVACRGTEGFDVFSSEDSRRDAYTDLQIATNIETNQQKELEKFMNELEKDGDYDGYYFTGHSLGGNLATHGAVYMAETNKVKGVRTYNAPGFNSAYCAKNAVKIALVSGLVINYQNEYDYVSSCFDPIGKTIVVDSNDSGWHFGFSHHDVGNLKIDKNGNFVKDKGIKSIRTQIVKGITSALNTLWFPVAAFELLITGCSYIPKIVSAIKEWCFKQTSGYKYASANPYIVINTTTMNSYANQLAKLSQRAKSLDKRMNSLYWKLGIEWDTIANLGKLLKAEVVLDFAYRLDKNVDYLRATASEFDGVEREIGNMAG